MSLFFQLLSVLICDSLIPLWDWGIFILDLLIFFFLPLLLPFAPYKLYGGKCVNCSCALRHGVVVFPWWMSCGLLHRFWEGAGRERGREEGREADGRARWKWLCIITTTSSRLIKQTNRSGGWVAIWFILVVVFLFLPATAVKRKSSPNPPILHIKAAALFQAALKAL